MSFDWSTVFSPLILLAGLCGSVLGLAWGAIPGLSVNMALALLLGVSYHWPTEAAVAFMLSAWLAGEFGGAVPAIINNIPGTPAAVMTQLAGHPLALRGEGDVAVGVALLASVAGSLTGILFLVTATPLLSALALHIGSWELALLALLGIAVAGNLGGRSSPIKGWIMGSLGLLVAMVGIDPIHGVERWTFGVLELRSSINFLPVLVGLFAVSEAIEVLSQRQRPSSPCGAFSFRTPFAMLAGYRTSILRSSLVGALIGSIPGAGANVASMVSYGIGERSTGRRFEDGDYEGVICSEVANNANVGGSLVPTLLLGIPGSNAAALFLAALALHGVAVGPTLAVDHPGLSGFVLAALLLGNLALLLSASAVMPVVLRLLGLRTQLLMPVVLVLAVCGTYAASYSQLDLVVLVVAGILGYWLRAAGFPLAPLVLGLILGPIADENLRRALLIANGDPFQLAGRPAGLVILGIGVLAIWWGYRRCIRQESRESAPSLSPPEAPN